jgi:hypothetical protein
VVQVGEFGGHRQLSDSSVNLTLLALVGVFRSSSSVFVTSQTGSSLHSANTVFDSPISRVTLHDH